MTKLIESFGLKGAQTDAVVARGQDVVVTAGAGAGKTRTLVARYLSLLEEGLQPRQIVAVTFTEKAAHEMRNRIRKEIGSWRSGGSPVADRTRWEAIEADVDAARIGTIHSLCAALLRAHPAEAGIDPRVSVLDEGLAAAARAQAVEDTLGWAVGQADLGPVFDAFTVRELEEALAGLLGSRLEAQAVTAAGEILSRWSRAICDAIAAFVRDDAVAAAVGQMRALRDAGHLEEDAGPGLALQARGLLDEWVTLERALDASDYLSAARSLQVVRRDHSALNVGRRTSLAKESTRVLRAEFDRLVQPWFTDKSGPLTDPEIERRAAGLASLLAGLLARAVETYQAAKDLRQAVDFDDLESGAVRLLGDPQIRARWQRQTAALLVDEFQDTNGRQRDIVEALAGVPEGVVGRLFVVGDAKQSIYRFRGAEVAVFRHLDRDVRARGGRVFALDLTFRAHAPLVGALGELLGRALGEVDDPSKPHRVPFSPLRADRPQPRPGIEPPFVEILYGLGDRADEARPAAAQLLATRLWELHDQEGVKWDDVALLFRAAAGFPEYEAALGRADIPFVTVAGKGFYDRPEIRDLLNLLRALADPWDDLAVAGFLRSPALGLSDLALYQLRWPRTGGSTGAPRSFRLALEGDLSELSERDRAQAIRARGILLHLSGLVDRITVAELIKAALEETMYPALLGAVEQGMRLQRNLDKLLADAHASGIVRVAEFLEYIDTLREGGAREGEAPAESGGAVRLMSVHRAKGLEFPVVVIADASRVRPNLSGPLLLSGEFGLVPCPQRFERKPLIHGLARAHEAEQSDAEDLRVLYVAATRAQEKLIVCGHKSNREASSWLGVLVAAAGCSLGGLAGTPGERQVVKLPKSGQEVLVLAQALQGEEPPAREPASPASAEPRSSLESLFRPVVAQVVASVEEEPEAATFHLRRITGRHRRTDGTVVGKLVHEALRRWRFPGDPALEQMLTTTALSSGLVDRADIVDHLRHATELLARLRNDARWAELDAAERYHEVPYSVMRNDLPSFGAIDLLYRSAVEKNGSWGIVDFKTDHIPDDEGLQALVGKYSSQMIRYREAVSRLLRCPVKTSLCFLDRAGTVQWVAMVATAGE